MEKISVLIPSYNSEKTIDKTLMSVKWADEIVIVDSGSTDKTLEICRKYAGKILSHEYINSAAQKNWAIPQCEHPWILQIDSDEVLEEGLKEEILECIKNANHEIHAFKIRRKNFAYGQWVRYGALYPDYQTRLFLKDMGRFEEREVHAHIVVPGRTDLLQHHLIHNDFKNLSEWFNKFDRYMRYESNQLIRENRHFSFFRVTFFPFALFIRDYLFKQGFRDGWIGFEMAILRSFYYFAKYAKLWEHEWLKRKAK